MKYLKEATILSFGIIGGFVTCGVVVVKSVIKSDTLRKVLANAISAKVENLIFGEENNKRQKVSYKSYYDSSYDRQNGVKRSYGYPCGSEKEQDNGIRLRDDIIFDTREDAEKTVDAMKEIVNKYGCIFVADLYDLAGVTATYKDNKYGWIDISSIDIVSDIIQGRNGYILRLPKVSLLK